MSTLCVVLNDPRLQSLVTSLEKSPIVDGDLIRFRAHDEDNHVAALVQSAELYDGDSRSQLRSMMTGGAKATLDVFARRRIVLGRRTTNVSYYHQALSAFSLLPTVRDVPWATWFLAALILGDYAEDADIVALFEGPHTAGGERCASLQKSLAGGESLAQCHLREVSTTYGLGLVALPMPHDVPGRGWGGAPVIDRDTAVYEPTVNLAQLTVNLADAFDLQEGAATTAIEFSRLATATTPHVRTLGCLHFALATQSTTMDVYCAETTSEEAAHDFVRSLPTEEGAAFYKGAVLVFFAPQPNFDDVELTPEIHSSALEEMSNSSFFPM